MPAVLTHNKDAEQLEINLSGCRGVEFMDTKARVKDIPGARFDWDSKLWLLPADPALAERLIASVRPEVSDELQEWVRTSRISAQQELATKLPEDAKLSIPWATERADFQPEFIRIGGEDTPFTGLLQHQRPVVDLAAVKRKLIVADDMGLGKTAEAISAVEEFRLRNAVSDGLETTYPSGPRLVVCPASVMGSWRRELALWLGVEPVLVNGSSAAKRHDQLLEAIQSDGWAVVNWEQLRVTKEQREVKHRGGMVTKKTITVMKEPLFEKTDWLAVIADEVHRAKNRKAQVTQGLWRTRADNGLMIAASGTPLMNSPDELWSILKWLWPGEYTSFWNFYDKYVDYYEDAYNRKVITGVKNADALRFELKGRLVRRTQGEVLDLPGKVRIPVPVELNPKQRKLYDEAVKQLWITVQQEAKDGSDSAAKFAAAMEAGEPVSTLYSLPNGAARMTRLLQIIETPANLGGDDDSAVLDAFVDKVMDSRSGKEAPPWVGFCKYKPTVDCLVARFERKGLVAKAFYGDVSSTERSNLETAFQNGEIDVLVGTIDAMYQGITLTNGRRQFWCSRDWTPAKNEQGEDRQNRIGQTERVLVFIAEPEDTVATGKVRPTNERKERIVRAVIPTDAIEEDPRG